MRAKFRYRSIGDLIEGRSSFNIEPEETVFQAAALMKEQRVGSLLVVKDSELRGIITERDVMNRVVASRLDPATTLVRDVMTESPHTIGAEKSLVEALGVMINGHFRHLPVMRDGSVVGVISIRDIPPQYWVMLDNWVAAQG